MQWSVPEPCQISTIGHFVKTITIDKSKKLKKLFSQKVPDWMFDRVLNTPLQFTLVRFYLR